MEGDERQVTTPDELDRIIKETIRDDQLPSLEADVDPTTAAASLTPDDRAALAELGSPQELVRRILAGRSSHEEDGVDGGATHSKPAKAPPPEDVSTHVSSNAAAGTLRTGASPADWGFDDLMQAYDACERKVNVSWSSHYYKCKEIGRGGQGVVYLAKCRDRFSGERALKDFSPLPYGNLRDYCDDMERLTDVASVVHQNRHDNLIEVERFACHDGIYMMVMRLIDGFDLRCLLHPSTLERLRRSVTMTRWDELRKVVIASPEAGHWGLMPGMAVNIVEKCLRGVSALHGKGIIHGDIKPSNIMLDCFGSIRLVDIGSAFALDSPPRQHAWSPRYAAPEVLERQMWSPQSDLASIGYVLVELLSGQPLFAELNVSSDSTRSMVAAEGDELLEAKRQLQERLPSLIPKNAQRSERLVHLCEGLIDPDPAKRFPSAEAALISSDGTNAFKDELVRADLAVLWVQVIMQWIADVKKASC